MGRLLVVFLLILGLFSCSNQKQNKSFWTVGKTRVLSTTRMIDDLVLEIGRERVDHQTLILGEIDPHSYELVKGDDERISSAQVVFYNGLGLEHGASLRYQIEQHPCKVALGEEIQRRVPHATLHVGGQVDPHVWMDISLWTQAIDPIVEALAKIDPEYADFYQKNGDELRGKMLKVHEMIVQRFQTAPADARYLVTSHDAFNYFARAYLASAEERDGAEWRKRFAAPEGLAPDGQLSCTDIREIIDHLVEHKICVVFPESNVSRDSLKKIVSTCSEMGHPVKFSSAPLYGDAVGPPGSNADGYLPMLEHNCAVLLREWGY